MPWWAKFRRARIHINEVRQLADALRDTGAWSVQREPAGADGWAYRLRVHRAIPADLAAVAGEAVVSMRSALDHIAYELARRHAGELDDAQETATAFPICRDEPAFRQFFTQGKKGIRDGLYGDSERRALQCVQPFALGDEARALGVEWSAEPADELLTDHAYALNALWNIDKHRRLPGLSWARNGPAYWMGNGDPGDGEEDAGFSVRRYAARVRELAPLQDGDLFYELHGSPGAGRPRVELRQDIDLVLTDDPSPYGSPLVQRLEGLHQVLTQWVVPRVFIVAGGSPPPIMISFAAPA